MLYYSIYAVLLHVVLHHGDANGSLDMFRYKDRVKMYGNPHCTDKTIVRPSYLILGIPTDRLVLQERPILKAAARSIRLMPCPWTGSHYQPGCLSTRPDIYTPWLLMSVSVCVMRDAVDASVPDRGCRASRTPSLVTQRFRMRTHVSRSWYSIRHNMRC